YNALDLEGARRAKTIQANRKAFNYRSVADGPPRDAGQPGSPASGPDRSLAFRMLDDDSVSVVVTGYGDDPTAAQLLRDLRATDGTRRHLFRALQPYTVALPAHIADRADVKALTQVVGDLLEWTGRYDPAVGIDDGDTVSQTVW